MIVEKLAAVSREALDAPDVREPLIKSGAEPAYKGPQAFAQFVRGEYERYGKLVRELGLSAL